MPSKTISSTTAKFNRAKKAFKKIPIPMTEDPEDENNQIPLHSEAEHVFWCIKRYVARMVRSDENDRQGKDNAPAFDEDIMTVS